MAFLKRISQTPSLALLMFLVVSITTIQHVQCQSGLCVINCGLQAISCAIKCGPPPPPITCLPGCAIDGISCLTSCVGPPPRPPASEPMVPDMAIDAINK